MVVLRRSLDMMRLGFTALVLVVCSVGVVAALWTQTVKDVPRSPVWDYVPTWTSPPQVGNSAFPDGPLMGNGGSVGVVVGGTQQGEQLTFYLAKNDFWAAPISGFSHLGYGDGGVRQVGGVDLSVPSLASNGTIAYEAKQFMGNGSVSTKHVSNGTDGLQLVTLSYVDRFSNLMVTSLELTAADGKEPLVPISLTLWTVDDYLPISSGFAPSSGQRQEWKSEPTLKNDEGKSSTFQKRQAENVESIFITRTNGWPYQKLPRRTLLPKPVINKAVIASRLMWDNGTTVAGVAVPLSSSIISFVAQVPANGQKIYLLTYITSNADKLSDASFDPLDYALQGLHTQTPKLIDFITQITQGWWLLHWNASSINWPDDQLTMGYWYGSQYVSALISREGAVAPGLFGSFVTMDGLPFTGDYTLNYNFESPYYASASSNHPELMLPFFEAIIDFMAVGETMAQSSVNCSGVLYPGHIGPWGMTSTDVGDMGQRNNAAFAAIIFAHYYMYTHDLQWLNTPVGLLQRTPYQFMTAVADFWMCYLQKNYTKEGTYTYNSIDDCTYELCGSTSDRFDVNPTSTLSFLRYVFNTLLVIEDHRQQHLLSSKPGKQAMIELERSKARAASYWDIFNNLAPYALGTDVVNGQNVSVFQASYNIPPQPPGGNPLDTYALWPAGTAGYVDPAVKKIARDTIQRDQSWAEGNAFPQIFPAAVRAEYNVTALLSIWRSTLQSICGINLYCSMDHSGIEGLGSIGTVNEMMLQSHEGFIRLFPLMPPGSTVSFMTLRAMNATLVSASLQSGKVSTVIMTSLQGAPIVLQNPWWPLALNIAVCYYGTMECQQIACVPPHQLCTFTPEIGQTYQISPFPAIFA